MREATFTPRQCREIHQGYRDGETMTALTQQFKTTTRTISRVLYLEPPYDDLGEWGLEPVRRVNPDAAPRSLTEKQVCLVLERYGRGERLRSIADDLEVHYNTVLDVVKGRGAYAG